MKKNKYLLIFAFSIIFILGITSLAFAATPEVANGPCANSTDLGSCVVSYFSWGISIAAIIATASFAVGAVMFMISGDNGGMASSGKDRMKGSVLGIVLLGASYLIMSTINLALVRPNITPLSPTELSSTQVPGVYFYIDSGCSQSANTNTTVSLGSIDSNIQGIKIVNDANNKYGYILHGTAGLKNGGLCAEPMLTENSCQPVNMHGAINVFRLNQKTLSAGNGVTFYSEPYGWNRGANAGYLELKASDIQPNDLNNKTPDSIKYVFTGVNVPDAYVTRCETFQKCAGSIGIKGSYLVAIYSDTSSGDSSGSGTSSGTSGGKYCQTFDSSVASLNEEPVVASGATKLSAVYTIATGGL